MERKRALLLSGPQHFDSERPVTHKIRRFLQYVDPLGIAIVSTILKKRGFETFWKEMSPEKSENLYPSMENTNAVFISSRHFDTSLAIKAIDLANQIKVPTIVGGYGPTFSQEIFKNATSRVIGEFEPVSEQVVDDLLKRSLKPLYDSRELPAHDITHQYIYPDRTIFPSWRGPQSKIHKHSQEWQRGCPNFCTFCPPTRMQKVNIANGERLVRVRSIDDIKKEIREIGLKRGDHLLSVDLNSSAIPEEELYNLFGFLKKSGIRWYTEGTVRPLLENLDKKGKRGSLLSEMSAVENTGGCYSFLYGADDLISSKVAGSNDKYIGILNRAVKVFRDFGIPLNLSVVVGLDNHHYPDSFYKIARILEEIKASYSFIHIATPYPGTVWGEIINKEGRILSHEPMEYNHRKVIMAPKNMTAQELQQGYFWLLKRLNSPDNLFRTAKNNFNFDTVNRNPLLAAMNSGLIWGIETYLSTIELEKRGVLDNKYQRELDYGYRNY